MAEHFNVNIEFWEDDEDGLEMKLQFPEDMPNGVLVALLKLAIIEIEGGSYDES